MEQITNSYELRMETISDGKEAYVHFNLEQRSFVILKITTEDLVEVRLLLNEILMAGRQKIFFSLGNLSSDNYLIRLIINKENSIDIENLNFKII